MSKIRRLVDLVREAFDKQTIAVEEVHKAIVSEPFELLKKIPSLEKLAKGAQNFQNQIIGVMYKTIRIVNQKFNEIAKGLLGEEKPRKKRRKKRV